MPRSAPGPVTGTPFDITRPVVGVSRPATARSSVDYRSPKGPRMVMNALSSTASETRQQRDGAGRPAHAGERAAHALDAKLAHRAPRRASTAGSRGTAAGSPT
jgi:hypothetical protein